MTLFFDHHNDLWIGTFGGLDKMGRQTGRFIHYPLKGGGLFGLRSIVKCIGEDQNNELWVGGDGLYRINIATGKITRALDKAYVESLCVDKSGVV